MTLSLQQFQQRFSVITLYDNHVIFYRSSGGYPLILLILIKDTENIFVCQKWQVKSHYENNLGPAGSRLLRCLRSLHTYQKMGLKRCTRIGEWEVKIYQGILGIRNFGFAGKPLRVCIWKYVMMCCDICKI